MTKDPYFSFGDEELESALGEPSPQRDGASATPVEVAERAAKDPRGEAKGRQAGSDGSRRALGGPDAGSPTRHRPSAKRARLITLLALGLAVALVAKALLAAGGTGTALPSAPGGSSVSGVSRLEVPTSSVEGAAAELRSSRRQAAEHERAQRQRAQTRRRARRHRERRKAERRMLAKRRSEAAAEAPASEAPAGSYVPPSYTSPSEPAPQPTPESQQSQGFRDGSHSPEFGL